MVIAPIINGETGASVRAKLNNAFASLSSRVALEQKEVHAGVAAVRLDGYRTAGDGGGALYVRANSEPSHPGKIRSADRFLPNGTADAKNGGWWELRERVITPEMFGAVGDADEDGNGSDDSTAIQAAIECAKLANGRVELGAKRYGISQTINIDGDITFSGVTVAVSILQKKADIVGIRHSGDGHPTIRDFTVQGRGPVSTLGQNTLESTPAGIFTRKCYIERIRGYRVGSPLYTGFADKKSKCFCWGFVLENAKDNVNIVNAIGLEGRSIYGDVVFVGRVAEAGADFDTNGMTIQVQAAVRFSAFAINYDAGWRSYLQVNHAEGGRGDYDGGEPGGTVRFGPDARSNYARVLYSAGNLGRGVVFEGYNNYVLAAEERQEDASWTLADPRNSYEVVNNQHSYRSIARATGSDRDASVGKLYTDFHSILPNDSAANYILLTKWKRLNESVERQQLYGTIFFGMNSNTGSSGGRRRSGHATITVRNQSNFSAASCYGVGPSDANLRLVTLTYNNEPWLALAQDSSPALFQHAYFSGSLTNPQQQLQKASASQVSDVAPYSPLNDGISYFGRPGDQYATSIAAAPVHVGQFAIVEGEAYIAVGTASRADWKRITT
jgi:hypothetical protein